MIRHDLQRKDVQMDSPGFFFKQFFQGQCDILLKDPSSAPRHPDEVIVQKIKGGISMFVCLYRRYCKKEIVIRLLLFNKEGTAVLHLQLG
jgi:hypothetical protein